MRPLRPTLRSLVPTLVPTFLIAVSAVPTYAQEPPPPIPLFAIDLHATIPRFPQDQTLADSRNMMLAELPGGGLGVQASVHLYPIRWRMVTFGIGGEVAASRARSQPSDTSTGLRNAEEKFLSAAPQLSFNFGSGSGWSYLSGGIGVSQWSIIPDGRDEPFPSDTAALKTINYGGGARWFVKPHVAFSFDLLFYQINPGTPYLGFPASPRTRLLIIGAGISLK
jgi:hypothetical protein